MRYRLLVFQQFGSVVQCVEALWSINDSDWLELTAYRMGMLYTWRILGSRRLRVDLRDLDLV